MKRNVDNSMQEAVQARIPVSEMVVDEYQGHVNAGLVQRIAKAWDDAAAGAVILNMRDNDQYAVLDGQHRVLAAKKCGVQSLNALVFVGKSREDEARLFVQLNTKHNVRPMDRFRASLFSHSKREVEIAKIVEDLGLSIKEAPQDPTAIRAVVSLINVYDNFGPAHLRTALGILQSSFSAYKEVAAFSDAAIRAAAAFIHRYPEASIPKLINKLSAVSPNTIKGMAAAKKELGQAEWQGWGRTFTSLYNHGIRSNSPHYLPTDRWDKIVYSPGGLSRRQAAPRKIDHLKKYQFKKGTVSQPQRLAAKNTKG